MPQTITSKLSRDDSWTTDNKNPLKKHQKNRRMCTDQYLRLVGHVVPTIIGIPLDELEDLDVDMTLMTSKGESQDGSAASTQPCVWMHKPIKMVAKGLLEESRRCVRAPHLTARGSDRPPR